MTLFGMVALVGEARGQWSEPDPAATVGRWSGTVTWKQCAAVGSAKIALEVARDGSGYRMDLGLVLEGLRPETLVPLGGATIEIVRDDLRASWGTKGEKATLRVELGGGCQATAVLLRDSLGVAGCDEVVGLRAIAATCSALEAVTPHSADGALAKLRVGRRVAAKQRASAEAVCRTEARPLRAALRGVGCVPEPFEAQAGPPIRECDELIATVVGATQCNRIPVDMKQRLVEQIRIVARSAAVAEPAARDALIESCRATRDEIVETLGLVGCTP